MQINTKFNVGDRVKIKTPWYPEIYLITGANIFIRKDQPVKCNYEVEREHDGAYRNIPITDDDLEMA